MLKLHVSVYLYHTTTKPQSLLTTYLSDVHHFDGGQLAGLGVPSLKT